MKKYLPILLVAISVLVAFFKSQNQQKTRPSEPKTENTTKPTTPKPTTPKPTTPISNFNDLRYRDKPVVLTHHAKCRMECRHIDASEIQEILDNGVKNNRKSGQSKDESTCPTLALEGKTHDAQTVRIVVAECSDKAKIVTVIDLKNDFTCDCK